MSNNSYLWWQEHGKGWMQEIDYRKSSQVIYHIQELVLLDYFSKTNFNRVLEFGCGFGRHLKYLREIPNLEVFGYDQSESMVSSITNWAEPDWIKQYIKTGTAGDPLPYPDNYFDAIFTTSVLIHVPPEDIPKILKELARVAKKQIVHQEPSPDADVVFSVHDGCWNHNLVAEYKKIGLDCHTLSPACKIQSFYEISLEPSNTESEYLPSELFLSKLLDLESSIQPTLNSLSQERDSLSQERDSLSQERDSLSQERDSLSQERDSYYIQLEEILNSRTWKMIQSIKSNYLLKKLGKILLNILNISQASKQKIFSNDLNHLKVSRNSENKKIAFLDNEIEFWLNSFEEKNESILAIYIPTWLGIKSATTNMFANCYPISESLSEEQTSYYASLLLTHGVKHLIIAGVCPGHLKLVQLIKTLNPEVRCDATWHGSSMQNSEDFAWTMFKQVINLARKGVISKIGFAKKGMEETGLSMGVKSEFLPNIVDSIPTCASKVISSNPQLGVWLSGVGYRKLPYAMIAAAHLVEEAYLNMSGVGDRPKEWADMIGVKVNYFSRDPIPKQELYQLIKNTHLSLYLTSSECAPMLPIESLSLGVPCLISPVSHWFEDDEYLHSRLVVPYPERPEIIAKYINQALEERDEIIERYKIYAERYNQWAKDKIKKFLED